MKYTSGNKQLSIVFVAPMSGMIQSPEQILTLLVKSFKAGEFICRH